MLLKQKLLKKELFGTFSCKLEISWWPGSGLFFFPIFYWALQAVTHPHCLILPKQTTKKTLKFLCDSAGFEFWRTNPFRKRVLQILSVQGEGIMCPAGLVGNAERGC